MKTIRHLAFLTGLSLTLLASVPGKGFAQCSHDRDPAVTPVTGQSDWSIVPPAIPSEYVTFHADGSASIRRMPLAGVISLTGDGSTLDATIKGKLSAELDATLSGPIYGPLTVTQKVRGKDKVIFEGRFFGRVNGLLASGQILLHGRGNFAGVTIAVSFLETEANSETFVLTGFQIDRHGD